jgi:hypothetical protein
MSASKYKGEELPNRRSTIYEIWDFDVRTASKSIIREFLNRRSALKVNEIWDFDVDELQNKARTNVKHRPRRLWTMIIAWLIKLGIS